MARRLLHLLVLGLVCVALSCATTFHTRSCTTDDDCGNGLVCVADTTTSAVCRAAASAPLRLGMSGPLSGPSQDLGTEMKKGLALAVDAQNAAGGVRGRPVAIDFRDDEYQPGSAEQAARDLLAATPQSAPARCPTTTNAIIDGGTPVASSELARGPDAVLGLVGNVGTPTMVRAAPVAIETQSLFFGAFTGASTVLRDGSPGPCSRYIFNLRASYAEEARATLEYFLKLGVPDARHVLSFDQNDSFGDAGYNGLAAAYLALMGSPASITRFRYTRDDLSSVPAQVSAAAKYLGQLLAADNASHTVGILMTDTYGPATAFITGLRDWQYAQDAEQMQNQKGSRLTLYFSNVSFVGPNSLADRLKSAGTVTSPHGPRAYSDGVFVSQVVPNYLSDNSDVVRDYRAALAAANASPSFTSLEGYLVARVFLAGLLAHEGPFDPDALVGTFEHLAPLNMGLGANAGFSPTTHNYSKAVFGTALTADGGFSNSYFWTDGSPIQLFE